MSHPNLYKWTWDRKLTEFARLEPGWDTYDSRAISPKAISAARRFLDGIEHAYVIPCSDGSVQIEWHVNGVDVEIEFSPDGRQG